MKRVWTARSLAAVLGGSLLYFLITVLVMMCGSFSPLFWVFLPAIIVGAAIGAWLGSPLWKRGQARIHITYQKSMSRIGIRRKGSAE